MRLGRDDDGKHFRRIEIVKFEIWIRKDEPETNADTHGNVQNGRGNDRVGDREREKRICVHIYIHIKHGRIVFPLLCHILLLIFLFSPHLCLFCLWFPTALSSFFFAMFFKPVYIAIAHPSSPVHTFVDDLPIPPSLIVWSLSHPEGRERGIQC